MDDCPFLSADELRISQEKWEGLVKTLYLFENNKIEYFVPSPKWVENFQEDGWRDTYGNWQHIDNPNVKFNLRFFSVDHESCGTVCCIAGTAAHIMGNQSLFDDCSYGLHDLFMPHMIPIPKWEDITVEQAGAAIRNYLTKGTPRWHEVAENLIS